MIDLAGTVHGAERIVKGAVEGVEFGIHGLILRDRVEDLLPCIGDPGLKMGDAVHACCCRAEDGRAERAGLLALADLLCEVGEVLLEQP